MGFDWDLYVEQQCCYDDYPDEETQYKLIKKWKEYTDEEMKDLDLEEEWESYLEWLKDCEAEYKADHSYYD